MSADVRHLVDGITVLASTPNHLIAPRCNALAQVCVLNFNGLEIGLDWLDITESHFWHVDHKATRGGCKENGGKPIDRVCMPSWTMVSQGSLQILIVVPKNPASVHYNEVEAIHTQVQQQYFSRGPSARL